MNYGEAGGLAQGLGTIFQMYTQERARQDDQKQKGLAMALQAKAAGVAMNPEGTGFVDTPETIQRDQLGKLKMANEMQEYDPNSPHAGLLKNIARQQVKALHPDYTDEQINQVVTEGGSAAQYKEAAGLLKPEITGNYGMQGRMAIANAMGGRTAVAQGNLELSKQKAANDLNKEVKNDKIVQATDMQQNSIVKGLQQLNSKDKPITVQMLNEIQADYANALAGGRQAAQGTIHDQQMKSAEGKLAEMKQFVTGEPTQAATPQQIAYFKTAFNELQGLNKQIRGSRVQNLTGGASAAFGNQGPFKNVISNLNENASGHDLIPATNLSPEDEQAIQWAKSNPKDPRSGEILKLHGVK